MIALPCAIKISAVHCLVLSQTTRVTDGQTDRRMDGQNYDFQDRASIAASRVKNRLGVKWLQVKVTDNVGAVIELDTCYIAGR